MATPAASKAPAAPAKVAVHRRRGPKTAPKLRKSLTPGTIVILLRGVYAGKRAVFIKQLSHSGELLVTGPERLNGVRFARVPQSAVIATSTKVDLTNIKVDAGLNEVLFKKTVKKYAKRSEADFFKGDAPTLEAKRASLNLAAKNLDKALITEIKKTPLLVQYLSRPFSLKTTDRPHLMKF